MIGLSESPNCTCGNREETLYHYLMSCRKYDHHRHILREAGAMELPLEEILNGSPNLTPDENEKLSLGVQDYIIATARFERENN